MLAGPVISIAKLLNVIFNFPDPVGKTITEMPPWWMGFLISVIPIGIFLFLREKYEENTLERNLLFTGLIMLGSMFLLIGLDVLIFGEEAKLYTFLILPIASFALITYVLVRFIKDRYYS